MNDTTGARRRLFLKGSLAAGAALAVPLAAAASATPASDLPLLPGMLDWKPIQPTDIITISYVWDLFHGYETVDVALDTWTEPLVMGERGTFHVMVARYDYDKRFGPTIRTVLADAHKQQINEINLGNGAIGEFRKQGVAVRVSHRLGFEALERVKDIT